MEEGLLYYTLKACSTKATWYGQFMRAEDIYLALLINCGALQYVLDNLTSHDLASLGIFMDELLCPLEDCTYVSEHVRDSQNYEKLVSLWFDIGLHPNSLLEEDVHPDYPANSCNDVSDLSYWQRILLYMEYSGQRQTVWKHKEVGIGFSLAGAFVAHGADVNATIEARYRISSQSDGFFWVSFEVWALNIVERYREIHLLDTRELETQMKLHGAENGLLLLKIEYNENSEGRVRGSTLAVFDEVQQERLLFLLMRWLGAISSYAETPPVDEDLWNAIAEVFVQNKGNVTESTMLLMKSVE